MLQVALESVSAAHQLVSAIHTLAICVRPLLLTGFAASPDTAESGPVDAEEHKVRLLPIKNSVEEGGGGGVDRKSLG